jgi:hypothetical protein
MEWMFQISYDRSNIRLKAKLVSSDDRFEIVKVIARNRTVSFKSNRPLLLSKGLKHRKITWELIEGRINNMHLQKEITKQLEDYLRVYNR